MWWQRREGRGDESSFAHLFAVPVGCVGGVWAHDGDTSRVMVVGL